jgi:hypothetical protein
LVGRHLSAGTERDQHAVRDIALCEPVLIGFNAIDVDLHGGGVHFLADEYIHRAGDGFHFLADFARHAVIGRGVAAHDLNIDGHGETEVENLIGDIRRLEEEAFIGESAGEIGAQGALIFVSAAALLIGEGDENFAIGGCDGGGIAEGQVDAAVG